MLNQNFYHGTIRKTIIAFGRLFSDIKITREDKNGGDNQTIVVPLAYAPKEKWIVRLEQDPDLSTRVYTTLPRLSFEISGYSYDASRKQNRMNKIVCYADGDSTRKSMFSPVPYNLDITLYVLTKTQEDALQIIEQILPTFTPEYTLSINSIPDMNVIQDIPVVLNSISVQDDYDGDFETRRFVTHTLTFTLKINLFGAIQDQGIIKDVTVSVGDSPSTTYNASAEEVGGPIVETWIEDF